MSFVVFATYFASKLSFNSVSVFFDTRSAVNNTEWWTCFEH